MILFAILFAIVGPCILVGVGCYAWGYSDGRADESTRMFADFRDALRGLNGMGD